MSTVRSNTLRLFSLIIILGTALCGLITITMSGCEKSPSNTEFLYSQIDTSTPAAAKTLKIGVLLPLTGPEAKLGEVFRNSMEMAVDREDGKIRDRAIKLVIEDEGYGDINGTLEKAKKLIISDKVDLILGPFRDDANLSVTQLIASVPLVNVKWSPTAYSQTALRYKYAFWTSQTNLSSTYALGLYAYDSNIRTATTLCSDDRDAIDCIQGFVDGFRSKTGKITPQQVSPLKETDYFPYLANMKNADAVVCALPEESVRIAFFNQFAEQGFWGKKSVFIAQINGLSGGMMQEIGDNVIGVSAIEKYLPEINNAENHEFIAAYRKIYKSDPDNQACDAYNGMRVLLESLKVAAGNAYPDVLGPIMQTRELDLPTGHFRYSQNRTGLQPLRICLVVKEKDRYSLNIQKEYPPTENYWTPFP
jgi:branched-chain amino acid transport system substrate-binding protein